MQIVSFGVRIISEIIVFAADENMKSLQAGITYLTKQLAFETGKWLYSASLYYRLFFTRNMSNSL